MKDEPSAVSCSGILPCLRSFHDLVVIVLSCECCTIKPCCGPAPYTAGSYPEKNHFPTEAAPRLFQVLSSHPCHHSETGLQFLPQSSLEELEFSAQRRCGVCRRYRFSRARFMFELPSRTVFCARTTRAGDLLELSHRGQSA